MTIKKYNIAIRDVIAEEMRRNEEVFLMGEDISVQGGIFGTSQGLLEEFGAERIRETPISESAFVGAGIGSACVGMRPIVELMYMDFTFVCMDQLLNQAAKIHYMFGGKVKVPMVIRSQQGIGAQEAGQHTQSIESIFMHIPGIKVAMPATPADAAGLLRTAIRDDNPCLIIEHKAMYNMRGEVPDDPDFMIPFGKAEIVREGKDVTIVATLYYRDKALKAAEILKEEGIEAEVIDPRTIVPLDMDTIVDSVKKTGHLITVHEAHKTMGVGAEITSQVVEKAFKYLDMPPVRIGSKDCTVPFNINLQEAMMPQIDDIVRAARQTLNR